MAAINIACWDIKGKALGQSVHKLLGGAQQRIRTYIAGGYYAEGKGLEELKDEVRFNVEELHAGAVKIKIGDPNVGVAGDMERVAAARDAIGDNASLLVDANCALDLPTAMEFARLLPEHDVYWFEEPLPIHDYEGHRQLAEMSSVKIATGGERLPPGPFPHPAGPQRRVNPQRGRHHLPRVRRGDGCGEPRGRTGRDHSSPRLPGTCNCRWPPPCLTASSWSTTRRR